jgi:hypothetical protein
MTMYGGLKQADAADKAEAAMEAHAAYADAIRFGPITDMKQIFMSQPQLYNRMTEQQKSSLENMMRNRAAGTVRTHSDRPTYVKLMALKKKGVEGHNELRNYFARNVDKLNETDFKFWTKAVVGEEPEGLFDARFMVEQRTIGWTNKRRGEVLDALDSWYLRKTEELGRSPDDKAVVAAIDSYLREVPYKGYWTGLTFNGNPLDLDEDDRVSAVLEAPTEEARVELLDKYKLPEQERIQVEAFKEGKPDRWEILQEHFIDSVLPPGTELTNKQMLTLIQKMESDPTWPPR